MNNKTKNIFLLSGFLLMLFLCWQFAFSKTYALKKEYSTLIQQQKLYQNMPQTLAMLKEKKMYFDSILKNHHLTEGSIQSNLLKTITAFSQKHQLKLVNFLEPHSYQKKALTVKTYRFVLEGSFSNMLKLIYHLEQVTKYGEIINLHFEKKENFRTNVDYLVARVLLQTFGK